MPPSGNSRIDTDGADLTTSIAAATGGETCVTRSWVSAVKTLTSVHEHELVAVQDHPAGVREAVRLCVRGECFDFVSAGRPAVGQFVEQPELRVERRPLLRDPLGEVLAVSHDEAVVKHRQR